MLSHFKRRITVLELEPSTGGCFEVTLGEEIIYSKLETGRFPNEDNIVKEIERLMK